MYETRFATVTMSQKKYKKFRQSVQLPTEENVIGYVNEYFDIFENNLENGKYDDMNTRLPRLIAEKFKKLFELWDENRVLGGSMDRKFFEDVYSSMSNTFGDDSDTRSVSSSVDSFILECKHCGEEFSLRNNDCKYSYDHHKTSLEHLKLTRYFDIKDVPYLPYKSEGEQNSEKQFTTISVRPRCFSNEQVSYSSEQGSGSCDEFTDHKEPLRIVESNPEANFIREFNRNCVVMNNRIRCRLCNSKFCSPSTVISHMNGVSHIKSIKLFESNRQCVNKIDDLTLQCTLCDVNIAKLYTFIKHCKKSGHRAKFDKIPKQPPEQNSMLGSKSLVDERVSGSEFRCPACQLSFSEIELLFAHLKSTHRLKAGEIKNIT